MHLRSPEECRMAGLIGGGDEAQREEGTGLQRNLYLILRSLDWVPSLKFLQAAPRKELNCPALAISCVCSA